LETSIGGLEAELTLSLEVHEPVGGLRLPLVDVSISRARCGLDGPSLDGASGLCRTCERGEYVFDPDAESRTLDATAPSTRRATAPPRRA
jgi:hypothetical protein